MRCRLCNVEKLSREFPSETITDECQHPPYYCLRCVTSKAKETGKCPYKKDEMEEPCNNPVPTDSARLREFEDDLLFLFPPLEHIDASLLTDEHEEGAAEVIHVTTLTGDSRSFPFRTSMTIAELKNKIKAEMKIEPGKQRLVCKDTELEAYKDDGSDFTLGHYKVQPYSTIHLMIILYAVPQSINLVVFEVSWVYPESRDYLDASCLLFMGNEWYSFIDWREKYEYIDWRTRSGLSVEHSGDLVNNNERSGHHTIKVFTKDLPKCVSHVFFIASSFRSPKISHFRDPTVKFYHKGVEKADLPHATFDNAPQCEALIMSCMSRTADNRWLIYKGGQESAGNAKKYRPVVTTIQSLIKSKIFPGVSLEAGTSLIRNMTAEESKEFHLRCKQR